MNLQNPQVMHYLDSADVARKLGVSQASVLRWVRMGKITYIRLPSGRVRFRDEDIAEVLNPIEPTGPQKEVTDFEDVPLPGVAGNEGRQFA